MSAFYAAMFYLEVERKDATTTAFSQTLGNLVQVDLLFQILTIFVIGHVDQVNQGLEVQVIVLATRPHGHTTIDSSNAETFCLVLLEETTNKRPLSSKVANRLISVNGIYQQRIQTIHLLSYFINRDGSTTRQAFFKPLQVVFQRSQVGRQVGSFCNLIH